MADVENVIYAIERCTCHVPDACRDCPYDAGHPYNECVEMLLKDVLELLKEQEPVPVSERWDTGYYYVCGNCGRKFGILAHDPVYCPDCGRAVKWDE